MTEWKKIDEGVDFTTYAQFPSSDAHPIGLKTVYKDGRSSTSYISKEALLILANDIYYMMHMMTD